MSGLVVRPNLSDPDTVYEMLIRAHEGLDKSASDALNARLAPLRSFVLPAGTALAAHLHLARTVVRRAERHMVALAGEEAVGEPALRYANRLSDYLFVAARVANGDGSGDVLWQPGRNRDG